MQTLDFSFLHDGPYAQWLVQGAARSILLFLISWCCAFALALLVVALRASHSRILEGLCRAFVAYHRNIPGLVQIFFWYFGISQILPKSWQMAINAAHGEFIFALIALALNAAAYMSEDLRSGIKSLSGTQLEAARALGLSYVQAMRRVVLPQALRIAVPPIVNQTLSLFKSTSLAMAIGVAEMTYVSHQIENETFLSFETYAIASVFYLVCSFTIIGFGSWLQRRLIMTTVKA
jgi:polar amino acid transport system permease protein